MLTNNSKQNMKYSNYSIILCYFGDLCSLYHYKHYIIYTINFYSLIYCLLNIIIISITLLVQLYIMAAYLWQLKRNAVKFKIWRLTLIYILIMGPHNYSNKGPFTYYVITFCLFLDPLPPSVIKFGIG